MEHDFWHRRWRKNEIGFHESEGSHLLKTYYSHWAVADESPEELKASPQSDTIFVPLCGKTRDIAWVLYQGKQIVACELNESAVRALFSELNIEAQIQKTDTFSIYTAPSLTVFVGDFFALRKQDIGAISGIYDRAALVALPQEIRDAYTQHLFDITQGAPQFLICYDYDQALFSGPPFSVSEQEVHRQYAKQYLIEQIYRDKVKGGFRGHEQVFEAVYFLKSRL